jgi:hypothetical protein
MSPISPLMMQRQFRELGRIRTGEQVEGTKNGKPFKRPARLATFRITSARRDLLDVAATLYGGTVQPWPDAPDGDAWQLTTATDTLDIVIPPGNPVSQWMELYAGGGCLRRCDGVQEQLSGQPCLCPKDVASRVELASRGEACKPTTRLPVILPRLPDLGIWLAVSHSFYAAIELAGTAELLVATAVRTGRMVAAELWIDPRSKKKPGKGKQEFNVLAIRIPEGFSGLLAGGGAPGSPLELAVPTRPLLGPGERPALPLTPPPATSDMRAPAPADWGDLDAVVADPGEPLSLVDELRETASTSSMSAEFGTRTEIQHEALLEILAPLKGVVGPGLDHVFGRAGAQNNLSAAEAQSIAVVARRKGVEAFSQAWRAMVAEAQRGAA